MAQVITNENFSDIISGSVPVVVDEGKAIVAKCNVDDCEEIAAQFGIRSIPTLLFFKDGQMKDRLVGAVPKSDITSRIDSLL